MCDSNCGILAALRCIADANRRRSRIWGVATERSPGIALRRLLKPLQSVLEAQSADFVEECLVRDAELLRRAGFVPLRFPQGIFNLEPLDV